MYNLNYTPTTLGVQSWREIIFGGTWTKTVEYHCSIQNTRWWQKKKRRHDDVWVSGGIAPPFLTSALDGGEWSASRPGRFTPREIASGNHWTGGWVGPRADLEAVENRKIKISCSCQGMSKDSVIRSVMHHYQNPSELVQVYTSEPLPMNFQWTNNSYLWTLHRLINCNSQFI
jgi:hypothetical protein